MISSSVRRVLSRGPSNAGSWWVRRRPSRRRTCSSATPSSRAPSSRDAAGWACDQRAVSMALQVVLETLTPAEQVAFVLHDVFEMPFAQIAETVGRTV